MRVFPSCWTRKPVSSPTGTGWIAVGPAVVDDGVVHEPTAEVGAEEAEVGEGPGGSDEPEAEPPPARITSMAAAQAERAAARAGRWVTIRLARWSSVSPAGPPPATLTPGSRLGRARPP